MLDTLRIENIAVIEFAEIEFDKGFCVLTGETGAGKSILIDALGAVLGNRTTKNLVRTGCENASVTAVFSDISKAARDALSEAGFDCDDGNVMLFRKITSDGKSSSRINGIPATAAVVKQISKHLVSIHGQHDSALLTDPAVHGELVDKYSANDRQREAYGKIYRRLCDLIKESRALNLDEAEKQRRIDMLEFQIKELEGADINEGEMAELEGRLKIIQNSEKIARCISEAFEMLSGDESFSGAVSLVSRAGEELSECADFSDDIEKNARRLCEIGFELENICGDIRGLSEEMDFDPAELERTEERLDLLKRLSKKYGNSEREMLDFLRSAKKELAGITRGEQRERELENLINEAKAEAVEKAADLTKSRKVASEKLEKAVGAELEFLNMPGVKFLVQSSETPLTKNGREKLEFLISANAGEQPKPLSKIASGGELSRTMLALLSVINSKNDADTIIFDEIDAGISGRAADKVGIRLAKTAENSQVICITHLAQIASKGSSHYLIEKSSDGQKTKTSVEKLDKEGRIEELARIIGGTVMTESTRAAASEMLESAD